MGNVEKLPKWAQKEFEVWRRRVQDAERVAEDARLATNPDETDTYIEPSWRDRIGLPPGERIIFRLGDEDSVIQVSVKEDHKGGKYLHVYGNSGLVIQPQVTNVINIKLATR